MIGEEALDEQREHALAHRVLEADRDAATSAGVLLGHGVEPGLEFADRPVEEGHQCTSRRREGDAPTTTLDDRHSQRGRGAGELPAHRRLREAEDVRRLGDVFGLRHGEQCRDQRQECLGFLTHESNDTSRS
ncbi:hypothetical protein QE397_002610 [Rhodococcus sp. SORGH_AS 301]|nr:hypothetical protein [Rhodococcus sp. SORGH_AS_0301]